MAGGRGRQNQTPCNRNKLLILKCVSSQNRQVDFKNLKAYDLEICVVCLRQLLFWDINGLVGQDSEATLHKRSQNSRLKTVRKEKPTIGSFLVQSHLVVYLHSLF